jgi:drug/metabolite transporter (DMT)-like permease
VTAVFWGVVILHETVSLPIAVGMVVVLAGIVLTNLGRRVVTPEKSKPERVAA